jgi:hypothetical protein
LLHLSISPVPVPLILDAISRPRNWEISKLSLSPASAQLPHDIERKLKKEDKMDMGNITDPNLIPSGIAPPGYPQNLINPVENRGPLYIIVSSTVLGVTALFFGLRMYIRLFVTRSAGLDDCEYILLFLSF